MGDDRIAKLIELLTEAEAVAAALRLEATANSLAAEVVEVAAHYGLDN